MSDNLKTEGEMYSRVAITRTGNKYITVGMYVFTILVSIFLCIVFKRDKGENLRLASREKRERETFDPNRIGLC